MSHNPWEPGAALRERTRNREILVSKAYAVMVSAWSKEDRDQCQLNPVLVTMVCQSYFLDLERKKEFHDIDRADAHKRSGYLAKWIMRFRPIQPTSAEPSLKALLANEYFCIFMAVKLLKVPSIPPNLLKHLLYALRYREVDGNAWSLSFFLLQQAYGPKCPDVGPSVDQ